jgi:hypothetical protein
MGLFGVSKKIRNMTPDEQYQEGLKQSLICNYKYAFQIYEPLAQQGHRKAQCDIAGMYDKGHGVKMDKGKALYWYEKSAEQNFTPAQRNCAKMYENGEGTSVDKAKALYWYEKVAEKGESDHMVQCGTMYYQGIGTQKDLDKAVFWLEKAEASGNPKAEELLREIRQSGQVADENRNMSMDAQGSEGGVIDVATAAYKAGDYKKALELFQKAAEQGNATAQFECGWMYREGEGTEVDKKKALDWFEKAAFQGNALAQECCGTAYFHGDGGSSDRALAKFWYERAADQGNKQAKFMLGLMAKSVEDAEKEMSKGIENGNEEELFKKGTRLFDEKDYDAAFRILEPLAEHGYGQAQYLCGYKYERGLGYVPGKGAVANMAKSFYWYEKAACQGNDDAQFKTGSNYYNGRGTDVDKSKALYWYEKSAEQGRLAAQYICGMMYISGTGTDIDNSKALYWYKKAAEQGLAEAQYTCGIMIYNGEGTARDRSEAKVWFQKAAEQSEDKETQEKAKNILRKYF